MKLEFGRVYLQRTIVHQQRVTFEIDSNNPADVNMFDQCSERPCSVFGHPQFSRIQNDYQPGRYPTTTGLLCRETANVPGVIWLQSVYFCPQSLDFWTPPYPQDWDWRKKEPWDALQDQYNQLRVNKTGTAAKLKFWDVALAYAEKHKGSPAFRLRRLDRPFRIRDEQCVGPWGFTEDHLKYMDGAAEAYQLKRWLHGLPSSHDKPKDVMRRAARRRLIKDRATASDVEFFKTLFGASQVMRWIKEANNKTTHATSNEQYRRAI
jgi:hypothetical protein